MVADESALLKRTVCVGARVFLRALAPSEIGEVVRVDARGVMVRFASDRSVLCEPAALCAVAEIEISGS